MTNRVGSAVATAMSGAARVAGYLIYYLLRAIYRPRERAIALGGLAVILLALILVVVLR